MAYCLVRICPGLVDIVEDEILSFFDYGKENIVKTAESLSSASSLAKKEGFMVRHTACVLKELSFEEASDLLLEVTEHGVEESRAIEALLPLMSEKARRRYVS
jgi:hypothetical protein